MKNYQPNPPSFWDTLPTLQRGADKPFVCMAPMADVTDAPFRRMFAKFGVPDITWTEFVSADGLFLRPMEPGVGDILTENSTELERLAFEKYGIGVDHPLLKDLIYTEGERPIVAQFFSKDPERMMKSAQIAKDLGYDGVDINMGCPADVICRQGAGSAMIKTPELAKEIILAAKEGAGDIPVSVKTRIGYNKNEIETWLPHLLETNPVCVTLHARTRKEMSKVPAQWEVVQRAVEIRDELNPHVLIAGNGDVTSLEQADDLARETGCDGVMVGRGIFGNPWFFNRDIKKSELPAETILDALVEHTDLFQEILGRTKNFALMRKHFKSYLNTIPGSKDLRIRLMEEGKNADDVRRIIEEYKSTL